MYISDVVDLRKVRRDCFNLIVSSCGTGKTYFCANTLLDFYGDVLPSEVLFVTSRSLAAKQLIADCDTTECFDISDMFLRNAWAGYDDMGYLADKGIQVTTYDKVIRLLNDVGYEALANVKIIVFDECHTIFSDMFIRDMLTLQMWIYFTVKNSEKIIIGLTATPNIIYYNHNRWNVELNQLCEPLYKYKAKNVWVVDAKNLPEFVNTNLTNGKTIIMCESIKGYGATLLNSIPKSKLLVSKTNGYESNGTMYDPLEMDYIRDSIISKGTLPKNVNVLVSTSTMREGYNLVESSGVKNIVCCTPDDISVIQLLGRCRYNVENLVIVQGVRVPKGTQYRDESIAKFNEMVAGTSDEWFRNISSLVDCTIDNIEIFESKSNSLVRPEGDYRDMLKEKRRPRFASKPAKRKFRIYLEERWIIEDGMSKAQLNHRMIDEPKKKEFVDKAVQLGIFGPETEKMSFVQISNAVAEEFGFKVVRNQRTRIDGVQKRYTIFTRGDE